MYGYIRCPQCRKILFEEDLEKGSDERHKCVYCGESIGEEEFVWEHPPVKRKK